MVAAFSGFVAGRVAGLQEFGVGLALAVFIDVTLVRVILVPSLMAIFGRWNWWLPKGRGPKPPPLLHTIYLTTVIARRIAGSW